MHRRPLLGMMLMVKSVTNAAATKQDPRFAPSEYISKEVRGEKEKAMEICVKIMEELKLEWPKMKAELATCNNGNWNDPGPLIDISFIRAADHGNAI